MDLTLWRVSPEDLGGDFEATLKEFFDHRADGSSRLLPLGEFWSLAESFLDAGGSFGAAASCIGGDRLVHDDGRGLIISLSTPRRVGATLDYLQSVDPVAQVAVFAGTPEWTQAQVFSEPEQELTRILAELTDFYAAARTGNQGVLHIVLA